MTVLSPEQARAFLDAAKGDRLEALYATALAIGLRQGEALGLRWQDVDLEAGTLRVEHGLQRIAGKVQLIPTKSARSRRTVVMPGMVADALRAHRTRQLQDRLLAVAGGTTAASCSPPASVRQLIPRSSGGPSTQPSDARGCPRSAGTTCATGGVPHARPGRVAPRGHGDARP